MSNPESEIRKNTVLLRTFVVRELKQRRTRKHVAEVVSNQQKVGEVTDLSRNIFFERRHAGKQAPCREFRVKRDVALNFPFPSRNKETHATKVTKVTSNQQKLDFCIRRVESKLVSLEKTRGCCEHSLSEPK